jgi:predicted DsbA family dithiol-disulfide isomerase
MTAPGTLSVTHFSDPGCPWAYSASPALAVLRWRYGAQLRWRHVMIGLTEHADQYVRRGYTPVRQAVGYQRFRAYGMPFAPQPRERISATARACRAVVATRLHAPDRELAVFRALQFAWFTTPLVLDEEEALRAALATVPALDADAIIGRLDDPAVSDAYARDRAESRTAAGGATEFQGKSAATDGPVRFTAPSLVFAGAHGTLEAGGFQPVEAYDVVVANLDRTLERMPPPEDPVEALAAFPDGLTSAELAAVMAHGNDRPDRGAAEAALIGAMAEGRVARRPLGDDALWTAVGVTPGAGAAAVGPAAEPAAGPVAG